MHKYFLIILSCCTISFASFAQEKKYIYKDSTLDSERYIDSVKIKIETVKVPEADKSSTDAEENKVIDTVLHYNERPVSPDTVKAWKNEQAFGYASYLDSLLRERQKKERLNPKRDINTGPSAIDRFFASTVTRYTLYVLGAFFVLFILYRLFLAEGVFKKPAQKIKTREPEVIEENISAKSDFGGMISQATRAGNYRLAVRYQYLRTLHLLSGKGLVTLAPDKTNFQYVREISNSNTQNDFSRLTLNYEYVWYGEFPIEEAIYGRIEKDFSSFNNKI